MKCIFFNEPYKFKFDINTLRGTKTTALSPTQSMRTTNMLFGDSLATLIIGKINSDGVINLDTPLLLGAGETVSITGEFSIKDGIEGENAYASIALDPNL